MRNVLQPGLAFALAVCMASWAQAADPDITFVEEERADAWSVWVMDADGSGRTEILRTSKQYSPWPNLLPAMSPDGKWVAVRYSPLPVDQSVLKMPSVGGDPQEMLCDDIAGSGPNPSMPPDFHVAGLEWSPSGDELVVQGTYFDGPPDTGVLAYLPAAGPWSCPWELDQLDHSEHAYAVYKSGPTWNHDGTRVAFLEADRDLEQDWLVIVNRIDGTEAGRYLIAWPAGESPWETDQTWEPAQLVWQRTAGSLTFAFSHYQAPGWKEPPVEALWLLEVDPTTELAMATPLNEDGGSPAWSPDDSQLLFSRAGSLMRLTLETGATEDLGSGYEPDWKRNPLPQPCESDADCDDSNPCTDNDCNGGICETWDNTALCDDGEACTYGDTCGGGVCSGSPIDDGSADGCSGWCCGGECLDGVESCDPIPVDCSSIFDKRSCNAEPACRWDNRGKICIPS